jgi:hypothetical protein
MKKIAISLLALAALSTASFAERSDDDSTNRNGGYNTQLSASSTDANALFVAGTNTGSLTAFERINKNAAENSAGGHDR